MSAKPVLRRAYRDFGGRMLRKNKPNLAAKRGGLGETNTLWYLLQTAEQIVLHNHIPAHILCEFIAGLRHALNFRVVFWQARAYLHRDLCALSRLV